MSANTKTLRKQSNPSTKPRRRIPTSHLPHPSADSHSESVPSRSLLEDILREAFGVTIWTTLLLTVFVWTHLRTPFSTNLTLSPDVQFMTILLLLMTLWDFLGLSLGSTLNPALTLSIHLTCTSSTTYSLSLLPLRLCVQLISTLFSVYLVDFLYEGSATHLLTPPHPLPGVHWFTATVSEAIATANVTLLALSVPVALGGNGKIQGMKRWIVVNTLFVLGFNVSARWSGACMNPAIALATAVLHRQWTMHAVYWVGPIVGSLLAALFHLYVIVPWLHKAQARPQTQKTHKQE